MATDLSAIQAYQSAVQAQLREVAGGQDADPTSGVEFGAMLRDAMQSTETNLRSAEQMITAGAAGQAELTDVATAVAAAEVTLETVVAVRDEVVRAYQEILRMPI